MVRQGDPGDALYVIVSGSAAVLSAGRPVGTLAPGDYFGELSVFDAGLAARPSAPRSTSPACA